MKQIEKYNDLMLARQLFSCWDKKRIGSISINEISEAFIRCGLAVEKQCVQRLIEALSSLCHGHAESTITLKEFLMIFEKE